MPALSLMEQGLTVGVDGEVLVVQREGQRIDHVRLGDLDEVLVFGAITLTPHAIAALLRRGLDVVFLTARGRYLGRLMPPNSRNVQLRLAQVEKLRDGDLALRMARAVVWGKISNQRNLLLRAQREMKRQDLARAIGGMREMLASVETAPDLEVVRGLEGQAAALYFGSLGKCVRNPAFAFERRTRRPPRDPANAVLSFGYTLLGMLLESFVLRAGLDPMLGFFHAPEHGRPSLALDILEEFRPVVVDGLMLRLLNRRELAPEDFESLDAEEEGDGRQDGAEESGASPRGVWLSDTGRRIFFRGWGRRLREALFYPPRRQALTIEQILRQQVFQVARVIRGDQGEYVPFVPR
jgi:CRISPR-associated protein Cas1